MTESTRVYFGDGEQFDVPPDLVLYDAQVSIAPQETAVINARLYEGDYEAHGYRDYNQSVDNHTRSIDDDSELRKDEKVTCMRMVRASRFWHSVV
jgi:hypothetical protein